MGIFDGYNRKDKSDKALETFIKNIFGFTPGNVSIYKLAFLHRSAANEIVKGVKISNERLEFLGDAILSAVVADYLYKKFPFKDEGFLTEIRSRLVSRNRLNKLSQKMGLEQFIQTDCQFDMMNKSVFGNTFEAFVGALYIDKGYEFTKKIIIENILNIHLDIESIENEDLNFKSRLIEWAQVSKCQFEYRTEKESNCKNQKLYTVNLYIDGVLGASGQDYSIKKAEQNAAEIFLRKVSGEASNPE